MASRHVAKAIVRAASVVVEGLETRRLLAYSVPGEYFDIGTATPSSKTTSYVDIKKDGVSTTLEATGHYLARGLGSFTLAYQRKADSENYQRLPDKAWVPGTYGVPLELQGNSDPWIGGNPVAADYVYGKTFTVIADRPARTRVFDSDYSDNNGNLTIELYQALILDKLTVSDANDFEVSAEGAMPPSTLDVRQKADGTADLEFDAEFTDIQHMLTESSYVLWKVMNDQEAVLYSGSFFGAPANVNVNPVTQGGSLTTRFYVVAGVDVDRDGTLDNDEIDKAVQTDLFSSPPPQLEDQVSASQNQRVDIHGVPLPDPSPTGESEADRIPNMAFIDAYSLTPSFSTTDVAVPMPGGELLMEFRRTMAVDSETTNLDPSAGVNANTKFSGEKILGPGWSTNLNSRVMVTYTANPISGQSKLRATVFDETGSSLSYKHGGVSDGTFMTPDVRSTFSNAALKGKLEVTGTTLAGGPLPDSVPTSFVLEKEHGTKLYFSRQGEIDRSPGLTRSNVDYYFRLDKIVDRNGNELRYHYDGDPRLVDAIYDPAMGDETTSTRRLDFQYDGGLLTKVIDPLDREFNYDYSSGRLASVEKPPVADPVTGIIGTEGPKVQFEYDVEMRAQLTYRGTTPIYPTSVEGLDLKQTVTWTLPTRITDARGHDTTFEYDFKLLPGSITEEGGTLKYSWDFKPQLTTVTTEADGTATFAQTRDSFTHAVTSVTDTMNHQTVYDFDSDIVDFNNSLGFGIASDKVTRTSKSMRDASGVTPDATVVYQYSNDVNANLVEVTDVSGNKVRYNYATSDSKLYNNPSSSVLAYGELDIATSYTYGPFRKLESQTDAEGKTTTYGFDANGNRTSMTEPGGVVTAYEYDSRGFMTRQTDPDGRVTEFVANDFGNLEYTIVKGFEDEDLTPLHSTSPFPLIDTDGKWLVSRRVADVLDRTLTEYDGRGNATSYAYDAWDRVTAVDLPEVIDPDWDPLVDGEPAPTVGGTSYTYYDFNSNVVKEIDELGNVTLNTYDDLNRKTETRRRMSSPTADNASDIVSSWTYDDRGLTATTTDPLGRTTAYDYDQLLRSIKTLLPGVTEVTTPGSTSTNPATTVNEYIVKTFYGANSGSGAFTFGGFNPTRVINARGYATDTQYDDAYRAVKTIQREDNGSAIASTAAPRAGEPTVETQYNDVHMPVRVTTLNETRSGTQANRSVYTFYDERYRTTATVLDFDGDGAGIAAGMFVSSGGTYSFDSDDFVTRTEYDDAGNAVAAIDALGRRAETDYDGASRAIESRAPAVDIYVTGTGLVSNFVATTTTVYDQASQPILVTDPRGTQVYTEYDARGRAVLSVLDLNGNGGFSRIPSPSAADIITWTGYDLVGNTIYSIDPNGNRSDTTYDRAYRAIQTQGPAVADAENGGTLTRPTTSTTYDNAGNVLTITDPRGLVTSTEYDEWNRARKVTANSTGGVNDADRVTTESRYDASGNKLALVLHNRVGSTDRPQVTTYTYDAFDRQETETLPEVDANDRITTTTYSRSGDVLTVVDPKGQSIETDYDRAGRVTEQRFKRADTTTEETRTSTYDKAGNLLSKTDRHGTSAYVYDAVNRVIEEDRLTTTAGIADTSIVLSGYDASGNRSRVLYPEADGTSGGRTLISTYDRANRMLQLDDSVTSIQPSTFDYDPAGNRKRFRAPNGVVTVTTFDAANRVLTHTATSDNGNGTVLYDLTYAYDLAGQRRSAEETVFNIDAPTTPWVRSITWEYDDLYRLTSESWTGSEAQTRTYTYAKAGNRTSSTVDDGTPVTTTYVHDDLNQLLSHSDGSATTTYTHDRNGNRVTKDVAGDTTTYVYDVSDRLIEAKDDSDDTIFSAAYDARTRRLAKTEGATTKLFRYDGGTNFQEVTPGAGANDDADNTLTTELIRAGGLGGGIGSVLYSDDLASSDPDSVEFFVYNAVGHTVALSDYSSAVTQSTLYEAFGDTVEQSGSSTNNRLRNTKERDASLGLDNDGFRYYDPATGRYIARDPIGYGDGLNVYHHVRSDPVNSVDPTGLETDDDLRWGVGLTVTISRDSDHRLGWSAGAYLGAAQRLGDNVDVHGTLNATLYENQQGVDRAGGRAFDLTASLTAVVGEGEGSALPINTLNNYTATAVPDTFGKSVAFGQMLTYNSTLDQTTIKGNVALKVGDVSAWYSNDSSSAPSFAGFFVPGWAESDQRSTDSGWTGGGGLNFSLPNGGLLQAYSETFTGVADGRFAQNQASPWTSPFYTQAAGDYTLNRTDTGVRYTDPEGFQFSLSYISPAYAQNYIHENGGFIPKFLYDNGEQYHRFEHDWTGGSEVKSGYSPSWGSVQNNLHR